MPLLLDACLLTPTCGWSPLCAPRQECGYQIFFFLVEILLPGVSLTTGVFKPRACSKPLPSVEALHRWECQKPRWRGLQGWGCASHCTHPRIRTPVMRYRRRYRTLCTSQVGIWLLYQSGFYGSAPRSRKPRRGTLPVSHAGNFQRFLKSWICFHDCYSVNILSVTKYRVA